MSLFDESLFSGGTGLVSSGTSELTLKKILENLSIPKSVDTIVVTTNTVALAAAGKVVSVTATAGSSAGGKTIISTGTPAAGEVRVTYDADGIPTLLFNVADAITETSVQQTQPLALT